MEQSLKGVIAIRHGEGTHNTGGFYSASPEHPNYREAWLTDLGRQQALDLAQQLQQQGLNEKNVCSVFASPLPRTRETAQIVMEALSLSVEKLFIETRIIESVVGDREGQPIDSFNDRDFWFPENPEAFGGETCSDVRNRMVSAYNEVVQTHREGYALLFSHGTPIYLLAEAITGSGVRLPTAGFIQLPVKW